MSEFDSQIVIDGVKYVCCDLGRSILAIAPSQYPIRFNEELPIYYDGVFFRATISFEGFGFSGKCRFTKIRIV